MKRVAIALLALASVAMLAAPAMATNLLLENFSYLDGSLVTVSGGLLAHAQRHVHCDHRHPGRQRLR